MDSEVTHTHVDEVPLEDEISLLQLANVFLKRRRLIVLSTFAGALLGLVVALQTPLEYTATSSFLPHGGGQAGLSGVASLAQQFGFSVPRSGQSAERTPEFYRDLIESREILDGVVQAGVDVAAVTGVTTVDIAEYFGITEEMGEIRNARAREALAAAVSVVTANSTGVVTVSAQTDDPGMSAAILRRLLDLISAFDSETRQSQATAERSFAEERLGQLQLELSIAEDSLKVFLVENRQFANSPPLIFEHDHLERQVTMRQELVTAMAQAYEQARVDEVRNLPIITVIDQPEPPALPDARGRLMKLILASIIGIIAGFILAFIREYGDRAKSEERQAYGEFQEALKDMKRDVFGLRKSRRPTPDSADFNA